LVFGVLLRNVVSPVTVEQANQILQPTVSQIFRGKKFAYPVCLFFFSMREDVGYFSWLVEPIVKDGVPALNRHDEARCVELTTERLNQTVDVILAWYDINTTVPIA